MAMCPVVGNCLAPRIVEEDITAVDMFGIVEPGQIAMFKMSDSPFRMAKVFLGITTSDKLKAFVNCSEPGPCAVFWMANPETLILCSLQSIEYLARVDGRVDGYGWYTELGTWPFNDDAKEWFREYFDDHIDRRPLRCFGSPPLSRCGRAVGLL